MFIYIVFRKHVDINTFLCEVLVEYYLIKLKIRLLILYSPLYCLLQVKCHRTQHMVQLHHIQYTQLVVMHLHLYPKDTTLMDSIHTLVRCHQHLTLLDNTQAIHKLATHNSHSIAEVNKHQLAGYPRSNITSIIKDLIQLYHNIHFRSTALLICKLLILL